MKWFLTGHFVTFAHFLGITEATLSDDSQIFSGERMAKFRENLSGMGKELHSAGFKMSSHIISDVLSWIRDGSAIEPSFADISKWSFQIYKTIQHEMADVWCVRLDVDQERFFKEVPFFGETVADRFSIAASDILSAGKCLGFERDTAAIFHLMRVLEVAIKAIWKTLELSPPRLPDSWGNLLKPMDEQLALPKSQRHPLWAQEETFFAEAVSDLRAIKKAWRDPTTHIEKDYTPEQALKVFNAVEGFMRDLAEKLDQDGTFYP